MYFQFTAALRPLLHIPILTRRQAAARLLQRQIMIRGPGITTIPLITERLRHSGFPQVWIRNTERLPWQALFPMSDGTGWICCLSGEYLISGATIIGAMNPQPSSTLLGC